MPDLSPYDHADPSDTALPSPDEPMSGYLLMAGVICGLIIAVGCRALLGHFAQRPELAQADPLMTTVITVGQWVGWALILGSLLAILATFRNRKTI